MSWKQLPILTAKEQTMFNLLVMTAQKKRRCPTTDEFSNNSLNIPPSRLAYKGYIKIEIFNLNWRVVTILIGEAKGKSTEACPRGGMAYRTISTAGDRNREGKLN